MLFTTLMNTHASDSTLYIEILIKSNLWGAGKARIQFDVEKYSRIFGFFTAKKNRDNNSLCVLFDIHMDVNNSE